MISIIDVGFKQCKAYRFFQFWDRIIHIITANFEKELAEVYKIGSVVGGKKHVTLK